MWLPEPIYERLPYAYLVIGVLFILGTFYIGLDASMSEVYLGLGFISLLSGCVVYLRRRTERIKNAQEIDVGSDSDLT